MLASACCGSILDRSKSCDCRWPVFFKWLPVRPIPATKCALGARLSLPLVLATGAGGGVPGAGLLFAACCDGAMQCVCQPGALSISAWQVVDKGNHSFVRFCLVPWGVAALHGMEQLAQQLPYHTVWVL